MRIQRLAIIFISIAILTLIVPDTSYSNSAYVGIPGRPVSIMDNQDIVLEKQVMQIWLRKGFAEVENVYQFHNVGESQEFSMGLPEDANTKAAVLHGIYNFNAYIDGNKVDSRVTKTSNVGTGALSGNLKWHVHNVFIAEGKKRVVVHKYWMKIIPWKNKLLIPLEPAASWRGWIGQAYYVLHLAGSITEKDLIYPNDYGTYSGKYSVQPVNFNAGKDQISWLLTNYEPKKNLQIEIFPKGEKAMPKVQASSVNKGETQKFAVMNAFDEDPATAWGVGGPGKNEWIGIHFDKKKWIREFRIIPGNGALEGMYKYYNRPHEVTLHFSDKSTQRFELRDELDMQYLPVKPVQTKYVIVEINNVYKGIYPDLTYISEIEFGETITRSKIAPANWKVDLEQIELLDLTPKYSTTDIIMMATTVVVFLFIGWQIVIAINQRKNKKGTELGNKSDLKTD